MRTSLESSSLLLQLYPVCLAHLTWFVRGEVSSHTATSKIYSKWHTASLCGSHLVFSLGIPLGLVWFLCLMAYQLFLGYLMPKPFS